MHELQDNAHQLAMLHTVSNEFRSVFDLDRLYRLIPTVLCTHFRFDRASLYLVQGDRLCVVGSSFGPGNEAQAQHFMEVANAQPLSLDSPTVEADVVRTRRAMIVAEPWANPRVNQAKQRASGNEESFVQVPIFDNAGNVVGLIAADRHLSKQPMTERDVNQLRTFCAMVGLTLSNARLYGELEQQVATRTDELREALERAQLADRRKSEFLASISHELRTPLNAIIGFSSVLLDEETLTVDQREDLESIHRNGRLLLQLINELLDLARIEAGHLEVEPRAFDFGELVHEVVGTAQGLLANSAPVTLHADVPAPLPLVYADPHRTRQVVLNLVANAIKFTDEGTITVQAYGVAQPDYADMDDAESFVQTLEDAPYMAISVRDTGIGVPEEEQARIFDEFRQVPGIRNRANGTGLGLAIVQRLVAAQGGTIWMESTPGRGSTFTFTVPTVHAPVAQAAGASVADS
jgi:two-component system sensor histidine kinase/response regulator